METSRFETTEQGYLPAGADIEAVLADADERLLHAVSDTYHQRRFLQGLIARAGRGDTEAERQRSAIALPSHLAEIDALAEVSVLHALEANRRMVELLIEYRWQLMRDAREAGESWTAIGARLAVSKQSVLAWYNRKTAERDTKARARAGVAE
ncbi:hypothetical protein [Nocardia brasiliensis]|uniref:hypothetical protein n=1 Tax=Nocardia brasiliensis TaxID=37326 RepID=UPI001895B0D0|nr:hypothetical protein [Nocardia brasiliensis]MBF6548859.1 hypothetical protein [Nocardia brasiliensis]